MEGELEGNHGGVIREEASWWRNRGGEIMEEESWSRNHGGGILEEISFGGNHGEGIVEEESGMRNIQEESWRRRHLEGTRRHQDSHRGTQETSKRHPGGIQRHPRHPGDTQEASKRHPGGTQDTPKGTQEALRELWEAPWGSLGTRISLEGKCAKTPVFFQQKLRDRPFRTRGAKVTLTISAACAQK